MNSFRIAFACLSAFLVVTIASSQTQPQASTVLREALSAQAGGVPTTDITLVGTISFPHSAQTGSFPIMLNALAAGTTRTITNLPSGTVTSIWSVANGAPVLSVTGPSGKAQIQAIGQNTLMPAPAWFAPIVVTTLASGPGYSATDGGSLERNGVTVRHLIVTQFMNGSQSPTDVYLDPTTWLPTAMVFSVNPHSAPGATLPSSPHASVVPEEIRFSDYQPVQGRHLPLHIQVFLGQMPIEIMDITISSAVVNSGATIPTANAAAN